MIETIYERFQPPTGNITTKCKFQSRRIIACATWDDNLGSRGQIHGSWNLTAGKFWGLWSCGVWGAGISGRVTYTVKNVSEPKAERDTIMAPP